MTVPMQVRQIDGFAALCSARGVERRVGLLRVDGDALAPGDWVLVSSGQAMQKISADEARVSWMILDELLAADDGLPG